jgi:hypothetical protein
MSYSSVTVLWRVECIVSAIAAKPVSDEADQFLWLFEKVVGEPRCNNTYYEVRKVSKPCPYLG